MSAPTLEQAGGGAYNTGFGSALEYSSIPKGGDTTFGANWSNHSLPRLNLLGNGDVVYEDGGSNIVKFTPIPGGYQAGYYVRDVLTHDSPSYILVSPDGTSKTFDDVTGLITGIKDKFGNATVFNYAGSGADELESVVITGPSGTVTYSYHYSSSSSSSSSNSSLSSSSSGEPHESSSSSSSLSSGSSHSSSSSTYPMNLVTSIVMAVGSSEVRKIDYRYTDTGNLEQVTTKENRSGVWYTLQSAYYRYYASGDIGGVPGLIKYVLGNDAVMQMQLVDENWPHTATDAELAEYADTAYTYHTTGTYLGRVASVTTQGGLYTTTFTYAANPVPGSGPNFWRSKTIVGQPDGSTHTFYYTQSGSLLLQVVSEPGDPAKVWYPICQQFDANARMILSADSASIAGVNESTGSLFTLKEDEGMNTLYDYDSNGNLLRTSLRKGSTGTAPWVTQRETGYDSHLVGGITLWFPVSETVFRSATDTTAGDPVTTYYEYEWFQSGGADTAQIQQRTMTLPAVPNSENGSNEAATVVETYNEYGFLTSRVDEMGIVTAYEYDLQTGAMTKLVEDVGGLNLTTDYQCDSLGRTIRVLGPEHTVSIGGTATVLRTAEWTQYLDHLEEVRTIRGYTSGGSNFMVNPVQIQRHFAEDAEVTGGRMTEAIAAVYSGSGLPPESATFDQGEYTRWSTDHFDNHGQQTHSRVYHEIPESGQGSSPDNYAQTDFGYDSAGRQNQTTSPEGTIQKSAFNAMGWLMETWVGTSSTNLVTTSLREYDGGADKGDGNLTKITQKVNDVSGDDRVQNLTYDWRNRQTGSSASDGSNTILSIRTYDNLNNVTQVDEYQGSVASENLINRAGSRFDARNRVYQTLRYGVDIGDGSLQPALVSNNYYDQAGRTVRQTPAGKVGFTVSRFDAVGRTTAQFQAYGGELDLSDPGDISDAIVVTQGEFAYDAAGNQLSTIARQRFDDATGAGELGTPSTEPKARVSYVANYPDALGRAQALADYGTNGASSWDRAATVPARSDLILVSTSAYDPAGNLFESTDPMGSVTRQEFDDAGRRTKLVENYLTSGSGTDVNKTTRFEYNGDNSLKKLIAENATTGNQETEWFYGVTIAQGSKLESNSLVYQKQFAGSEERVSYKFNRQGQPIGMVDEATTTHEYSYDLFGRMTEDTVTNFGPGVDTTVQRIARTYEVRGMLSTITSFGVGSSVLNQVKMEYDAYSQLVKDFQEHDGEVTPTTTPRVEYSYEDGTGNTVRPTGITYPNDAVIEIAYDGTDADALSRPDAIKEDGATIAAYRYLGSATVVDVTYDSI